MKSSGIGDTAVFGPELEFFVFDDVRFDVQMQGSFFKLHSSELPWNSGAEFEGGQGGVYHVSGTADVSYAEAALFLAQRIGAAHGLVEPAHGVDSGMPYEELTPFTSLATSRLARLSGFVPPHAFDVLQDVYGPEIAAARAAQAAHEGTIG